MMKRATCPNDFCRRPLLFSETSEKVRCRVCNSRWLFVNQLIDSVSPKSLSEEVEWMHSLANLAQKNGGLSRARLRNVNRLIDGVCSLHHCSVLSPYAETMGIADDGHVKQLSEMGRSEPINVTTLSDYAFAIRKEHIDVDLYGSDLMATEYLLPLISAIGQENGKSAGSSANTILVPLRTFEPLGMLDASCLIAKACVGREFFFQAVVDNALQHLRRYADVYRKRASADCDQSIWSQLPSITSKFKNWQILAAGHLDLAILSNVMLRPILLLNVDQNQESSKSTKVFVPFLWEPQDCRDRRGKNRSPLLFAYVDHQSRRRRVVLVSTVRERGGIAAVRLSRNWFKSVWGFDDEKAADRLLNEYLDFDDQNRCLVANGKYFKPDFVRRIVSGLEGAALRKVGIELCLFSELLQDDLLRGEADQDIVLVNASFSDKLWRCVECEHAGIIQTVPQQCWCCRSTRMRRQGVDGRVEYFDGDHTMTPAPNSWCFMKRKHLADGMEYDNPPQRLVLQFEVNGKMIRETVYWFSGESQAPNSDVDATAKFVVQKYAATSGCDPVDLGKTIKKQMARLLDEASQAQHKLQHLQETLGTLKISQLMSDYCSPWTVARAGGSSGGGGVLEVQDIEAILANAGEMYQEFFARENNLRLQASSSSSAQNKEECEKQSLENREAQTAVDENVIEALSRKLQNCNPTTIIRLVCSKRELFRLGGYFYSFALRMGQRNESHFWLPLLGRLRFSFCDEDDCLLVCLPGGHSTVNDNVDRIVKMVTETPSFTETGCDEVD